MLREIIAEPELDDHARTTAYVWLAESRPEREFKIDCLQRALDHEPDNAQVREMLERLRTSEASPQIAASQPVNVDEAPPVVGIRGGPNEPGSGFVVNQRGLVATTGYVTGSATTVEIGLGSDGTVEGRVVRRFPSSDLALIETPVRTVSLGEVMPAMLVARDDVIFALTYPGTRTRGVIREAGTGARSQWLVTSLSPALMSDAGGNPIGDTEGKLVGMLTRNIDQDSGGLYALGIGQIQQLAEQVDQEQRLMPDAIYCGACGSMTRAHRYGGVHCETCGARLPEAPAVASASPDPERLSRLYAGDENEPCPVCAASVGFYAGRCLRCGRELTPPARWATREAES